VVVVAGEAGIGKSALVGRFVAGLDGTARVLVG
jgi:predicted ATPase